ncbi:hypothetical protein ANN_14629 [Periplaneta americana]|uniref:Reverse transcriptase n=1 Tax=Periplaneta americana TaxID=6978 RepID=A0ABQ8SYC1_PERAM|nr:hypothetical protein ANN_14629 [Periplaneta americana]
MCRGRKTNTYHFEESAVFKACYSAGDSRFKGCRLEENPQTIRENTGILLEASKEIGLEVNPEKTKYVIMSRDENIVRNGNIKIGNLSFEEVEKFKYLGATVTNINDTREEIKHRINMGNACYYSVEKISSSSLLSKNLKVRIYKTVILPVVLYGCETWTLTLREEHRLRVFENKMLRKIFGAKRDEVTGEWRKLHNTELHALYSSPDIIRNIKSRRLRWAGHVARMGESRNAYRVLVGRPEGKRPLGRPRRRWEDNIKMDLREVGYADREWINLAQDRDQWRAYVRAAMNLRFCVEILLQIRSCVRAWAGSPFAVIEWFLPSFSPPVRLKSDGLWRVLVLTSFHPFGLITWLGFSEVFPNHKANARLSYDAVSTSQFFWNEGENAGEMSPESSTDSYPAFGYMGLRKTPKKHQPGNLSLPGFEPGPPDYANTPILCMFVVCVMEVPCANMNNAFRTEGYHIDEYLLSMGLDERLCIAKEGGNERGANRPYFGCNIENSYVQLSRAMSAIHARAQQCVEAEGGTFENVILRRIINIFGYLASERDESDNAGEVSPGVQHPKLPAFAHIGLRDNPGKKLNHVTCPNRESNPDHLVLRSDALTVTPQKTTNLSDIESALYAGLCRSVNPLESTTRCCHPGETETLGHVLGFCRKTELLRNNRHHKARTDIADVLKRRGWEVLEEIHCVSSLNSNRRADIVAIHRTQSKGIVLDPTLRLERDALQAQHVDEEKKSIYESCIPYLSEKYNISTSQWSVSGLLFGARDTLPKFTCKNLKALGLRFF